MGSLHGFSPWVQGLDRCLVMCASNPSSRVQGLDRRQPDRVMGSCKDSTEGTELVEVAVSMVWCFQFCGE